MKKKNTDDQWSATKGTLRSTKHQRKLAQRCAEWMKEEKLNSADAFLDDVLEELYERNEADLFDYDKLYIDLLSRTVSTDLRNDTRHQMRRLLAKANRPPKQRLQEHLVDFHMWIDLAVKCRNARKEADTTAN